MYYTYEYLVDMPKKLYWNASFSLLTNSKQNKDVLTKVITKFYKVWNLSIFAKKKTLVKLSQQNVCKI